VAGGARVVVVGGLGVGLGRQPGTGISVQGSGLAGGMSGGMVTVVASLTVGAGDDEGLGAGERGGGEGDLGTCVGTGIGGECPAPGKAGRDVVGRSFALENGNANVTVSLVDGPPMPEVEDGPSLGGSSR
jgi:hypothetical protein